MAKTRSTLIMDADLWKRFKMIAILNEMEVSELVEQALREKLERMKQLEQYPEYKDVRNLRVHKGEQAQGSVIHSSRSEATKTKPQQQTQTQIRPSPKGYLEFSLVLSELKFPMTKSEIIESVKKVKYQENDQETRENMKITINILNQLPDDSYNKNKLEREVSNILMRKLRKLGAYEGRVITIVYDEKSQPEQPLREKQSWVGQFAVGRS